MDYIIKALYDVDEISTEVTINVTDLLSCIRAIEDGNSHVAQEILEEVWENYHYELRRAYESSTR
jgi:hypothetical protein